MLRQPSARYRQLDWLNLSLSLRENIFFENYVCVTPQIRGGKANNQQTSSRIVKAKM